MIEAFPKHVVMSPEMEHIGDFLENVFNAQKGLTGWGMYVCSQLKVLC